MRKDWKAYLLGAGALTLGLASSSASAWCDKITGGGWIIVTSQPNPHPPAKGTFGAGGGCKHGQPWGHLEYHDHGNGLNVHWLTITGYIVLETVGGERDPKRTGRRHVCGTARTNLFGDVDFRIGMVDAGEPGSLDRFAIRLGQNGVVVYTTEFDGEDHLGGGQGHGGGNIQLHKPNRSTEEFAPTVCNI